jgi:hypothetical protein
MPENLRRYAYACTLVRLNRVAKAPTQHTTYSILLTISLFPIVLNIKEVMTYNSSSENSTYYFVEIADEMVAPSNLSL